MRAILLASATATTLNGRRASSRVTQGNFSGLKLGPAQDRNRADHEYASQVAVALFGDRAELRLSPGRHLSRHQPNPSRKVAP